MDKSLVKQLKQNAHHHKASFLQTFCAQTQSTLIDSIGHTAVIYRKKPEDKKKKSN